MINRLNYNEINPKAVEELGSIDEHLNSIEKKLKALVELRVSQINGCPYCLDLHANQARNAGETQQRLDCLSAWKECSIFTDKECAALDWAEAVTYIGSTRAPVEKYETLKAYFSEKQIVDLTFIISLMNSWNRIAISFRATPDPQ